MQDDPEEAAKYAEYLAEKWKTLTPRQIEVISLVSLGYSNRQVADKLCVNLRAVESHLYHIFSLLDIRDRAELAHFFRQKSGVPLASLGGKKYIYPSFRRRDRVIYTNNKEIIACYFDIKRLKEQRLQTAFYLLALIELIEATELPEAPILLRILTDALANLIVF